MSSDFFLFCMYFAQLVEALRHKTGGPVFDSRRSPWKTSSGFIIVVAFSSPGVHSASNRNECQGILLGGKMRPASGADSSAILAVPNAKARMEAQHSIPYPRFCDLLDLS